MKRNSYSTARSQTAKQQRVIDGAKRNATWQTLSTQAKIASLDARLGVNIGAKRQRAKLEGVK
jgi:hypothetical protein